MKTSAIARSTVPSLPSLVEAIGSDVFGARLLDYLHETCGADHCAVFQLGQDSLSEVASGSVLETEEAHSKVSLYVGEQYWRRDPAISEAQDRIKTFEPVIIRVDVTDLADTSLREDIYPHIRERLVLCGRQQDTAFGLSILRSDLHGAFSVDEVGRLSSVAEVLVALLAKHADILLQRPNLALALTSLRDIENCLVAMTQLPRREVEVCARILYGLSTAGISLDLDIGEESVKTYRKRAYKRLELGSERELLTWYLGLWSAWRGRVFGGVTLPAAYAALK